MSAVLRPFCASPGEAVQAPPGKRSAILLLVCAGLLCVPGAMALTQTDESPGSQAIERNVALEPIPDLDISTRAGTTRTLARNAEVEALPDSRLVQIQRDSLEFKQDIDLLLEQAEELLAESGSTLLLREVEKSALRASDRLNRWMRDVSMRSAARQSSLQALQAERMLWETTETFASHNQLPQALRSQISESLRILQFAERSVRDARDSVLALQADIAQQQAALESVLIRLQREISRRSAAIFQIDSKPLWQAQAATQAKLRNLPAQLAAATAAQWREFSAYVTVESVSLTAWLLLWFGLSALLVFAHRNLGLWIRKDPSLESAATLFKRPLAGAAVIVLVIGNLIDLQAPSAWLNLLNLLLLLCVVYLLLGMLPRKIHLSLYLLVPGFVLFHLVTLVPLGSITQRLAIISLAGIGSGFCLAFLPVLRRGHVDVSETLSRLMVYGLKLALLLYAAGMASSFIGNMTLGALLVQGTASAIFTGVVMWVLALLLRVLVQIALVTDFAHQVGVAPEHVGIIRARASSTIAFVAIALWIMFTLRGFELYDPAMAWVMSLLSASFSVGDLSLSLGGGLLFALLIWLSVKLAALTGFAFGELILPRLRLPQGAPHAISRLLRYAVLFIGLLVALSALGFNLSQAAIVAGGLGVGIGFGLQNVVSNFVAGLILLFERPIRVGDIVELGTTGGVVESIGMRATLVRTWRGSEIIVPNSQLISSSVVNWTLMHNRRRIEIEVGVEFSSDPDAVAKLLVETAIDHPGIDKHPQPQCLFTGFGDSTLNFQVRAWAEAAKCLNLESELRFAIYRNLKQAGVTIPFPQRDLHLRSMPPGEAPSV